MQCLEKEDRGRRCSVIVDLNTMTAPPPPPPPTDPEEALSMWYNVYLNAINLHAPLKHKRVKHPKLPPW